MIGDGNHYVAAVESVYAAAASPEAWPMALQAIAAMTGDVGANLAYRRDDGSVGTVVSPGLEVSGRDYPAWQHLDIRFARLAERGYLITSDVFTDRHVVTSEEVEIHPFYVGFLAAHGLKWVMATSISPDPKVAAIVAVQRAATRSAFSDDELQGLARIGRHVENALRLSIRITGLEATNVALADALSRLDLGVFLIDGLGRAVPGNAMAGRVLGEGLVLHNGRLAPRDRPDREAFDAALTRVSQTEADDGAPQALVIRNDDAVLVVYVMPVRPQSSDRFSEVLLDTRALVLVRPSAPGAPPDPAMLRDLLDLTLGEARIAALVGTGLTPRQAAAQLGIAEETARTVLKRVFAKTGISRQSELAGLITRLLLR